MYIPRPFSWWLFKFKLLQNIDRLRRAYDHVEDIDLFVGMILEDATDGPIGKKHAAVNKSVQIVLLDLTFSPLSLL